MIARRVRLAGWLCLLLLLGTAAPGGGVGLPTLISISIDGDLSDWDPVLANPVQVTHDGDGSSYGAACIGSTDRDCEVKGGTGRDLLTFAWTYDPDNLYLLIERWGSSTNIIRFFFVMDLDGNDYAEASDRVLLVEFRGSTSLHNAFLLAYIPDPAGSGSDSLVDGASGFADGYRMPGAVNPSAPLVSYLDVPGGEVPPGYRFETSIPWTDLGVEPGTPLKFHVAAHNNSNLSEAEDNMGGPAGGMGTFGFGGVQIIPAWVASAAPADSVLLPHTVINTGNLDAVFDLQGRSSLGLSLSYYSDPDGDAAPDELMAVDANGDGDFEDALDQAPSPVFDSNTDGRLDFAIAGLEGQAQFVVEALIEPSMNGLNESLQLRVEMEQFPGISDQTVDRIAIGFLTVYPDQEKTAMPGQYVDYSLRVTNNQLNPDTSDFEVHSDQGWTLTLFDDPDQDGQYADDGLHTQIAQDTDGDGFFESYHPPADSDGNGLPDTGELAAGGGTAWYLLRVQVDPAALPGATVDLSRLAVRSAANPNRQGQASVRTNVHQRVEVEPDYLFADNTNLWGAAGKPAYFPFVVINSWIDDDTFDLTGESAQGWPVVLWSDPNGNGSFEDGTVVSDTGLVERTGGRFHLVAEVRVPPGAAGGVQDTLTLTARSRLDSGQSGQALGQLEIHQVVSYRDALYRFQATHFATCETVYTLTSGLEVGQTDRYQHHYLDSAQGLLYQDDLVSDARGEARAQRFIADADPVDDWVIQLIDVNVVDALDQIGIRHERQGSVESLQVFPDPTAAGANLHVFAGYRSSNRLAPYSGSSADLLVLTPDGTRYLRPDGSFATYSGSESSTSISLPVLYAGSAVDGAFTVDDVAYPELGGYSARVTWKTGCGAVIASQTTTFDVDADSDQDGIPDGVDICPSHYNPLQDLLVDPDNCGGCGNVCDDGVACTRDACILGECAGLPDDLLCDDSVFCNGPEVCEALQGCQPGVDPCDDGLWCTGQETCVDEACVPGENPCPGQACDETNQDCLGCQSDAECDDGLFCSGRESCLAEECQPGSDPCPGRYCDEDSDACLDCRTDDDCADGVFCNGQEICQAGTCQPGADPCPGQVCSEAGQSCEQCLVDSDCGDQLWCNGQEICIDNSCYLGHDPCPDLVCNEARDECLVCAQDQDCDDGLWCNGTESCDPDVLACAVGDDPCPFQECDQAADRCLSCGQDSDCDDGLWCNGQESCSGGICSPGADPCPGEACDEGGEVCRECLADDDCDDGVFCNGPEICFEGACQAGTDPCSGQSCDEGDDLCIECIVHSDCNDGVFCNGVEMCGPGNLCLAGQDPCIGQICDEDNDECKRCAQDPDCDDGIYCNGFEDCQAAVCQLGSDPCPGQVCDEVGGECLTCSQDVDCDDGEYCNGPETCQADFCRPGSHPCSGGLCDESLDACVECLVDLDCDDGLFCNGPEACLAGVCGPGQDPCPGRFCDEGASDCSGCQGDWDCDDQVFCNGDEQCIEGVCFLGPDPCPGMICLESNRRCMECAVDADCLDELYCNGVETCTAGFCHRGEDPCPGLPCLESLDTCNCIVHSDCDDRVFCNGYESCLAGLCQPGQDPCAGQVCDESAGECRGCVADRECDDGLLCNGRELCDQGACLSGEPLCDDRLDCTEDICSEPGPGCRHEPDHSRCDDGDACTRDTCDAVDGCRHELLDGDADGICDAQDACPLDPENECEELAAGRISGGGCGCGADGRVVSWWLLGILGWQFCSRRRSRRSDL